MTLERIDGDTEIKMREGLHIWAENGNLPADKSAELANLVRHLSAKEKSRWWQRTVASLIVAVLVMLLITNSPTVRSWAVENFPIVGEYIAKWSNLEKGWQWAIENEMFQEVLVASTDQGYTVNVHKVLADPTQTTIFYTVEGENPQRVLNGITIYFNGEPFFGSGGGRGEIIDGIFVGSYELNRGLSQDNGIMSLRIRQIGDVQGNWDVSFPVTRAILNDMTRIIEVNKNMEVANVLFQPPFKINSSPRVNKEPEAANGILTVEQLVLAPTQTVIKLSYKNEGQSHNLFVPEEAVSLITPKGSLKRRGGSIRGIGQAYEYELRFQQLDQVPETIILKLSGLVYQKGETRLPLISQQVAEAPDGRIVYLDKLMEKEQIGQAEIRYTIDKQNPWPYDTLSWQVLDDQGELHRTTPSVNLVKLTEVTNSVSEEAMQDFKLQLEWTIPADRKAIALVNPGYWEFQDQLGEVTIEIPRE